jgi:hypothetical protein
MDTKNVKFENQIELIDSTDEAFSSVSLNPNFQWGKIVICDDLPNLNKMRIPESEFDNLIRTGINSPIKMDIGKITGHDEARGKPIGVISQIKKETNKLIALVALWKKEREEDIAMLKDMYLKSMPPQTSWEIGYTESKFDENGIEDLYGTMLNGLAVVANPAYAGRTGFVAMSEVWTTQYIDDLPDSAFLFVESGGSKDDSGKTTPRSLRHLPVKDKNGKVDPSHAQNAIARAPQIKLKDGSNISPAKAAQLQDKARKLSGSAEILEENSMDELDQLKAKVAELEGILQTKETELTSVKSELQTLQEYKAGIEKKEADETKLASIRKLFSDAKIEKDDSFYSEKRDMLLGLGEAELSFMIQEMVAFSSAQASADPKKVEIPNIPATEAKDLGDPKKLAQALRELKTKK